MNSEYIIFIDENIPLLADSLKNCGEVVRFKGRDLNNSTLLDSKCNILFVRSTTKVNEDLLKNTNIRLVGTATSGIDHIDTGYLKENNIAFVDAHGSNSNSVAEYVVYCILKWGRERKIVVRERTIGIIGYGSIGGLVARYAEYLGLRIIVNDPPLRKVGIEIPDFIQYEELDSLLARAEIITNHVPLTYDGEFPTHHLIGDKQLDALQEYSLFIHASRGKVVDENALMNSIKTRNTYTAIDVWENEPGINAELARRAMFATTHIAGYSRNGKIRGAYMMAEAFHRFTGLKTDDSVLDMELDKYSSLPQDFYGNEEHLYNLLKVNRKLDEDHQEFLKMLSEDENNRASIFDKLRKEYPERWETL